MIFGMPLAIIFGILTIILLFITATYGVLMYKFKKPVFKYHKIFAFLTVILALIHAVLAFMLFYLGIRI